MLFKTVYFTPNSRHRNFAKIFFVCFSLFLLHYFFQFCFVSFFFAFFFFLFFFGFFFSFLPVWLPESSMSFMVLITESSRQSAMQVVLVTHTAVSLAPYTCAPLSGQDKQWAAARHHLGRKRRRRRRRKAGIVFFQSESSTRTLLSSISLVFLLFNGQHCYQKSQWYAEVKNKV